MISNSHTGTKSQHDCSHFPKSSLYTLRTTSNRVYNSHRYAINTRHTCTVNTMCTCTTTSHSNSAPCGCFTASAHSVPSGNLAILNSTRRSRAVRTFCVQVLGSRVRVPLDLLPRNVGSPDLPLGSASTIHDDQFHRKRCPVTSSSMLRESSSRRSFTYPAVSS